MPGLGRTESKLDPTVTNTAEIERLLVAARKDPAAGEELFERIYADLRRIARGQLRKQPATISTTEVVHEAYFRLGNPSRLNVRDRGHLFAVAAKAMRQLLVDRFRRRAAQKRGGNEVLVTLEDGRHQAAGHSEADVLALDEALTELAELGPRMAQIVEMKFFGGLTHEEIAEALELSTRTVGSDWRKARAWLAHRLQS